MRSARPRAVVAAAAAVGFVVLAACTTSDPGPAVTPKALGPLEELLATGRGLDVASDAVAAYIAETARWENAIAVCMAEQGFDYIPVVPDPSDVTVPTASIDRDSRAFAEQYGYGIATDVPDDGGLSAEFMNPNWDALQAMSETEREAFDTALWGVESDTTTDANGNSSSSFEGGCITEAADPLSSDVTDEAGEFLKTLPEDAAFGPLDAEWSACMAQAGFGQASPQAAEASIMDRFAAEVALGPTFDEEEAAALAKDEVPLAVASWDCKAETDYEARFRVIRDQVQQAWIDEHRAELDEWLAAMAEQ